MPAAATDDPSPVFAFADDPLDSSKVVVTGLQPDSPAVADGRLVATCDASEEYVASEPDCPYPEGATLALLPSGTVEYTGEPVDLRFDEAELYGFRYVTGALVGGVRYFKDGEELPVPPISVGTYVAQVLVTPMGEAPYAYEREFRITKPSGGYADGFEVKSTEVRYDTMAEALAAAGTEGTNTITLLTNATVEPTAAPDGITGAIFTPLKIRPPLITVSASYRICVLPSTSTWTFDYFFGSGAVPLFLLRCQRFCWNGFVVSSFFAASVAGVS